MPKQYENKGIICPFYKCEEGTNIFCEGFCKSTRLHISFSNYATFKMHREVHCKSFDGWEKCPIFPVINKQYEGGEKNK